jgi:hypothetical protein
MYWLNNRLFGVMSRTPENFPISHSQGAAFEFRRGNAQLLVTSGIVGAFGVGENSFTFEVSEPGFTFQPGDVVIHTDYNEDTTDYHVLFDAFQLSNPGSISFPMPQFNI